MALLMLTPLAPATIPSQFAALSFSRFTELSAIVAALLTGIAPIIASLAKSTQVRRSFSFASGDEIRIVRGEVGERVLRSKISSGESAAQVLDPIVLSEAESKMLLIDQSYASLSRAELKVFKQEKKRGGKSILIVFAAILLIFGVVNAVFYWNQIRTKEDLALLVLGLILAMVSGMFVQVLAANYRSGNPLFAVGAAELIFPLLFSLIVFYPIWALATNGTHSLFSYYTAFLNGYFWQNVVSAARLPSRNPKAAK